jgi:hypothetical protein
MKRIKFEVIVTDNGVTITDRDRLFYNFAVKDGEMTDNLQCDIPKGTEEECVIRSRCMNIVRDLHIILGALNKGAFLGGKLPPPVVSKYAEAYLDPTGHDEDYRELLRRRDKETIEMMAKMFRNIEESKKNIKISHLSEKS